MTTEHTPLLPLGQPDAVVCDDDGFCAVPEAQQQTENTQETAE
jgi:hypothetical protein